MLNFPLPPWPGSYIGTFQIGTGHIGTGQILGEHIGFSAVQRVQIQTVHRVYDTRPAFINQSGRAGMAVANDSRTMPVIGIFDGDYASGAQANIVVQGMKNMSPLNFSGRVGQEIYASYTSTGGLCFQVDDSVSGAITRGLFLGSNLGVTHSGAYRQRVGYALATSVLYVAPGPLNFRFPHDS